MAVPGINDPITQFNNPGVTPTAMYPKTGATDGQATGKAGGPRPDTRHKDYMRFYDQWVACRDCVEGELAVKGAGVKYLPQLEGQSQQDYQSYRMRASFYAAADRTVKALSGSVMRKPAEVKWVESEAILLKTIGASGEPLDLLAKETLEEMLTTGRCGLYVDAPPEDADGVPYVAVYYAENITNWRWGRDSAGRKALQTVVLKEEVNEPDPSDDFKEVSVTQYRRLLLKGGVYAVEVWRSRIRKGVNGGGDELEWYLYQEITPARRGGKTFNYIPFLIAGGTGLNGKLEKPPILDLVMVNLSHYRNSADLEHGLHFTALPTAWAAGFDSNGAMMKIGSQTAWVSEAPNAKAGYLEFTGAGLRAIEDRLLGKQQYMAILGARLLEDQKRDGEAADTVRLRHSSEHSVLSNVAQNCSIALTQTLRWVADWLGKAPADPADIEVELNTDFNTIGLDSMLLSALLTAVQAGYLSWDTFIYNVKRGELLPDGRTPDEERELIALNPQPAPDPNATNALAGSAGGPAGGAQKFKGGRGNNATAAAEEGD